MERLTDRIRAQKIKENADKLRAAGVAVSPDHELYIRLAEYENAEEDGRLNYEGKTDAGCESES